MHKQYDKHYKILSVMNGFGVVISAIVDRMMETCMSKISEEIKSKVVELIKVTCTDALQYRYFIFWEGLKFWLFSIVEHSLTEAI